MARYSFTAPDGIKYSFANKGQFAEFVRVELNSFSWFRNFQHHHIGQHYWSGIIQPLEALQSLLAQEPEDSASIEANFSGYINHLPALHAKSANKKWIDELAKVSHHQAAYALAALGVQIGRIAPFDWSAGNPSDWVLGLVKAHAFTEGLQPGAVSKAHQESAAQSAMEAASALANARDAQDTLEELSRVAAERDANRVTQREAADIAMQTSVDEKLTAVTLASDGTIAKAAADWQSFQTEINSQLALSAPSTYWATKHKRHATWVWILGLAAVVVGAGGAWTLHEVAASIFAELKVSQIPTWFQTITFSLSALVYVLALRSVLRLLMSHVHLALDSAERQTMIISYLALARKGEVKDESLDKILSTIFRPTGDGIVKDEGIPLSILGELLKSKP